MRIKSDKREIFHWMDEHLGFKNAELSKAFPEKKDNTLRAIKSQYAKAVKSGKWPIREPDSTIKKKSIDTSIQEKEQNEIETPEQKPIESADSRQSENESIDTSKNESIESFTRDLFERKDLIMRILNEYQQAGSLSAGIKLEKPFKTVSFNLMERTIEEFSQLCKSIGTSQRKAIHIAMNDFIQRQGPTIDKE